MRRNNRRVEAGLLVFVSAALTPVACGQSGTSSSIGNSGTMGSAGALGSGGSAGATDSSGAMGSAGATGSGGGVGATGSGAGAGASAGSGAAGSGAGGGSGTGVGAGSDGGASDASIGGDGPVAKAGCGNNNYPLCIDFENGIDTTTWTGGNPSAIVTTDFAHGGHSYRLYPPGVGALKTTKLGTIKDQLWSRFYVHFKPGAPGGHGNIIGAYDQSNNWYEIGWQFDGIMGVWHGGGGERPLRSTPLIVDQWYCVESFFDGTKTNMPQWWIDGQEAQYYMALNTTLIPKVVTQFVTITAGFTPYAGLGLQMPDGKLPIDPRVLSDAWIDDIAFDTKRIGCIQ
jgi:hypothetical protein